MTVGDVFKMCEYIKCKCVDANGENIEVTKDNMKEIYEKNIWLITAKDNIVIAWTFDEMNEYVR